MPSPAAEAAGLRAAATRSRRSFPGLGLAGLAGLADWRYLLHTPEADGIPSALRRVLDFNARLTSAYYLKPYRAPSAPPSLSASRAGAPL